MRVEGLRVEGLGRMDTWDEQSHFLYCDRMVFTRMHLERRCRKREFPDHGWGVAFEG